MTASEQPFAAPLWYRPALASTESDWKLFWGSIHGFVLRLFPSAESEAQGDVPVAVWDLKEFELVYQREFVPQQRPHQESSAKRFPKILSLRPRTRHVYLTRNGCSAAPKDPAYFAAHSAGAFAQWNNYLAALTQQPTVSDRVTTLHLTPRSEVVACLSCRSPAVLTAIQKTFKTLQRGNGDLHERLAGVVIALKELHAAILSTDVELQDSCLFNGSIASTVHPVHVDPVVHRVAEWLNQLDVYITRLLNHVQILHGQDLDDAGAAEATHVLDEALRNLWNVSLLCQADAPEDDLARDPTKHGLLMNGHACSAEHSHGSHSDGENRAEARRLIPSSRMDYNKYWKRSRCI